MKKTCPKCGIDKELDEFYKDQTRRDGLQGHCKECDKQRHKQYYETHKKEKKQYDKQYYKTHREGTIEHQKQYNKTHREEIKQYGLKKRYNISIEEFNQMLVNQNHKCKICGVDELNAGKKGLSVDHDHKSGKVRGLLCSNCNTAVGLLKENINILKSAIKYLDPQRNYWTLTNYNRLRDQIKQYEIKSIV